jgi:hypothetical protein
MTKLHPTHVKSLLTVYGEEHLSIDKDEELTDWVAMKYEYYHRFYRLFEDLKITTMDRTTAKLYDYYSNTAHVAELPLSTTNRTLIARDNDNTTALYLHNDLVTHPDLLQQETHRVRIHSIQTGMSQSNTFWDFKGWSSELLHLLGCNPPQSP